METADGSGSSAVLAAVALVCEKKKLSQQKFGVEIVKGCGDGGIRAVLEFIHLFQQGEKSSVVSVRNEEDVFFAFLAEQKALKQIDLRGGQTGDVIGGKIQHIPVAGRGGIAVEHVVQVHLIQQNDAVSGDVCEVIFKLTFQIVRKGNDDFQLTVAVKGSFFGHIGDLVPDGKFFRKYFVVAELIDGHGRPPFSG